MSTSPLRKQFQATSTKDLKNLVDEEDTQIATKRMTDTYSFVDGLNKLRLFPKHPGEKSFYHILCQHWITIETDDGPGRRTVINARIHGKLSKDPLDEYINMVKNTLSTGDAEDSSKLKALTSYEKGMHMQSSWLAYANSVVKDKKEFVTLEFKKTVRDAINDESIIEDENEAIDSDPFTDPDNGKPLLITYNSKAKKAKDYYKIQVSKTAMPLTDEELEKFSKVTPLSKLPLFEYTMEKFETALEGIRYFDDENEIGLFESAEFQEIVEEIRAELSGGAGEVKTKTSPAKATFKESLGKTLGAKKPVKAAEPEEQEEEPLEEVEEAEEQEEQEEDIFASMDRTALKKYIAQNALEIKVFQSTTDDAIREAIRAKVNAEEEAVEEEAEPEEEQEEEAPAPVVKKVAPKAAAGGAKPLTLDQIKSKLRNGK